MSELLDAVLNAHGGLSRWQTVRALTARLSLGGPFWGWKGWPDVYSGQTVHLDAKREVISFDPFPAAGQRSVLDVDATQNRPELLRIEAADGTVIEERENPRATFPTYETTAKWDAIQTAYFTSCATWNYLSAPFVFTYPGVETRELEPWQEDGETWRRLAVHFPPGNANHNPDQVFYYDEQFRQRRMDYQPDVTGSRIAHYSDDPVEFDGFVFYHHRRIHLRNETGIADKNLTPITLDIESVKVEFDASGDGRG